MEKPIAFAMLAGLILLGLCVEVAFAHEEFLALCVCVVNALARSVVACGSAVAVGVVTSFWSSVGLSSKLALWLLGLQSVLLLMGIFFAIQHIFFALGLA